MTRLLRRIGLLLRNWRWWTLDYVYAVYWQVQGALFRVTPDDYLDPASKKQPILLLPGVYETWQFLRPLADHLRAAGHSVHVVPLLGRNVGSVPDAAQITVELIRERDLRDVVIVAHSKGGLIGKMAMLDDEDGRIDRMFAIATPFSGSVYARFLVGNTLRAFSPGDPTLTMLGKHLETNSRITSVWAEFDPHIPGGSRLEGATNIEIPTGGHFRVMGSPLVLEALDVALADDDRGRD
jgi:hypothetical protein